jgi:predicted ArsR family transcriptional regulator
MAGTDVIPAVVDRFVRACIPSVGHMEALLLLRARPADNVTPDVVAAALFLDKKAARRILEDLVASRLVHAAAPEGPYAYAPSSPELREGADQLAEAYRTRLVALSRFIHERAEERNMATFASAFRLRKD